MDDKSFNGSNLNEKSPVGSIGSPATKARNPTAPNLDVI